MIYRFAWSVQVNVLLNNCKQKIASLSLLVGMTVALNLAWTLLTKKTKYDAPTDCNGIYLFAYWIIFHDLLLLSADIFKHYFSQNNLSGITSECQKAWIEIRYDVLLGLIWVQTVCKDHQQTTKHSLRAGKELLWQGNRMSTIKDFFLGIWYLSWWNIWHNIFQKHV